MVAPLFEIQVSREGSGGGPAAFVCHVGGVVGWLGVYSGAEVSSQPPQGGLHESFTVTIFLQHPLHSEGFRPILTETVYPLADGGPVALVRSRTMGVPLGQRSKAPYLAGGEIGSPTERS